MHNVCKVQVPNTNAFANHWYIYCVFSNIHIDCIKANANQYFCDQHRDFFESEIYHGILQIFALTALTASASKQMRIECLLMVFMQYDFYESKICHGMRKCYIEYADGESNGISAINNKTFTSRKYVMKCANITLSTPTANLMVFLR